jgi:serine/threonine protein kinase
MAPEIIFNAEQEYDDKIDIWSIGITALELSDGKPSNSLLSNLNTLMQIINNPPPELNKYIHWS